MFKQHLSRLFWTQVILSTILSIPVSAQVIPDNSLGSENSVVTPNVTVKDALADLIEGGAIRGNNLFHSFSEFNVNDGAAVYFANPDSITNILTRVTGNNLSEIFGTVGVDGTANLFLLNPNGIVFGENAALDVSGSFLATTADSYIFENGFEYSASNPNTPPLLTFDIPIGIQMGTNSAAIEVRGVEKEFPLDEQFSVITEDRPIGLEVDSDSTLALVGGEINLIQGDLTTFGGKVELGAVGESETVWLDYTDDNFSLDYREVARFQDINLTQRASIDVTGSGAGNIRLKGNNISLLDGSVILANTTGTENGGEVNLVAENKIVIRGQNSMPAIIAAEALAEATGDAADLKFQSNSFLLGDAGVIDLETFGQGNSGDLVINASEIEISQETFSYDFGSRTGIYSQVARGATGKTGNVNINGDRLLVKNGVQLVLGVFGEGNAGDATLNVSEIQVIGSDFSEIPSGTAIATSSDSGVGNGGDLTIKGNSLVIKDGAQIDSSTTTAGKGGNLTVDVSDIQIVGVSADGSFPSALFSASEGTGNAGDLNIKGNSLIVKDGAQINSGTFNEGKGGNLTVDVSDIQIVGVSADSGFPSALSSASEGTGNARDLTIKGDRLLVKDGAIISSGTFNEGKGGNLTVDVSDIQIVGVSADSGFPSGLFSSSQGTGNAGDLTIKGDRLILKDGAPISSGTYGEGKGGNLTVNVSDIEIIGVSADLGFPSGLYSNSLRKGDGGDLTIKGNSLILKDGGQINSGTRSEGKGGNLTVNVSDIEITGTTADFVSPSRLRSSSQGTGNAGDLSIKGNSLLVEKGGSISASTASEGNAGNLNITTNNIEVTGTSSDSSLFSNITANSDSESPAGSLDITTDKLNVTDNAEILVSNTDFGDAGNMTVTADEINLKGGGSLNAEVNAGNQGNINLTTDNIFIRDNSKITVTATGAATGGNIAINNTDNIVLLDNSQIIADAIQGNGGNINITTQGLFVAPDSLISASSELGLDGNVEIEEINGDRKFELNQLSDKISDLSDLITVTCLANEKNAFAAIGNGGIPNSPYSTQSLNTTWYDLRPVKQETDRVASLPAPLTEATTTMIDADGELELVALTPLSTHRWINSSCSN